MTQTELTIRQPDDWHLHLRDGAMLKAVLPHTSANFARAIIMPNLVPPVVRTEHAQAYRERILNVLPAGHNFEPLMTLYLTEATDPADVRKGAESGLITALKLYPSGATTNSENGVRDFEKIYPVLETMSDVDVPLLVHGEVTDADIDIFDREAVFLERVLSPIREKFPELRIVLEHATTSHAIDFVKAAKARTAATITTHHLIINRNAILAGGIKPHYYCLPVAKRETHRLALRQAATSGDPRFFLGTDSAPHPDHAKESACGCAGIYSSINTINCLAHVFEEDGALDKLEGFASLNGPAFYKLPPNEQRIRLFKSADPVSFPDKIQFPEGTVTVFDPGYPLHWQHEPVAAAAAA
ncbi:dihydroorotase [Roseibium alexandrii]|uniref:Dihydroorotase n=1 Tax=Roseibium alexandrii TaxID=388408 RepID=A0A0M7AKR0_9HYPH|nr:dihydroorotase [Roseibium alexandrii]CTQ75469.1 Dihydroorotase [Roseibium alexandrii]